MIELYELLTSKPPRRIKMRMKGGPSFCCSILLVAGSLSCVPVVGASSASAPGPSTYIISSTYPTIFYVVAAATIFAAAIAFISLVVSIYHHRRGSGNGVRAVLDVLIRPLRERLSGVYISVGNLKVGDESLDHLTMNSGV